MGICRPRDATSWFNLWLLFPICAEILKQPRAPGVGLSVETTQGRAMKPIIAAVAIVSLIAGAAIAQTTTTVTKETTITKQDEPKIKEFVAKEHVRPVP